MTTEKLYTVAQAAEIAGVAYSTMTAALRAKRVPGAQRFGNVWLIPEAGLQWYMAHPAKVGRPKKEASDE